mmetsp:Transcript_32994/g.56967  ORF Transcript_32994/g.56967 Transcript_32994/m.56967 type:complete len:88 (-) Transcript_32994:9-272(-)
MAAHNHDDSWLSAEDDFSWLLAEDASRFLRYSSSAGSTSSRGMSLQCWVVAVTRRVGRHVHEEAEPPASAGGTMPENAAVHVKSCND